MLLAHRPWWVRLQTRALSIINTHSFLKASFTEHGVERDFHVSETVAILAISLFVGGLGLGPLLVGPLSEVYGRNIVYRVSYFLFFVFQFPVAFAPNAGSSRRCSILFMKSNNLATHRDLPNVSIHHGILWVSISQCIRRYSQRYVL